MLLEKLFVYPVKSVGGIEVEETRFETRGPIEDRRWMLVGDDGAMLSQRDLPRMALIAARFEGDAVVLEAEEMEPLTLEHLPGAGEPVPVRIWNDELVLPHPEPRYSEWFSRFLGRSCRLVYLPDSVHRPVEPPFDNDSWHVSLADGFPVLLLSEASLAALNERLPEPILMNRFRPNLVVSGIAPYEEDRWRRVRMGDVEFELVKPCERCAMVLVNQETAERGLEPLKTLNQYRRDNSKVLFGQNALVTKTGSVRAGSAIEILETV